MLDPILCAHMRILDNLQQATQQALAAMLHPGTVPLSFSLACRSWLLDQLRRLALQQQSIAASRGWSRRVGMYDDMLYALCQDHDLVRYHAPCLESGALRRALVCRVDEMRAIVQGFTPHQERPPCCGSPRSPLHALEAGPLSAPGALAGLVGWWIQLHGGTIELDAMTHQLHLSVEGSAALVDALIDAQAPLRYLRCDILISWRSARGLMPRSGPPTIILCEATDQEAFRAILDRLPSLTAHPPQDNERKRG